MSSAHVPPLHWRKAARSAGSGNECVEVASLTSAIAVRDSKNPDGPKLIINAAGWRALTSQIKAGQHELA